MWFWQLMINGLGTSNQNHTTHNNKPAQLSWFVKAEGFFTTVWKWVCNAKIHLKIWSFFAPNDWFIVNGIYNGGIMLRDCNGTMTNSLNNTRHGQFIVLYFTAIGMWLSVVPVSFNFSYFDTFSCLKKEFNAHSKTKIKTNIEILTYGFDALHGRLISISVWRSGHHYVNLLAG